MGALTNIACPQCGAMLELNCGEFQPDGNLDLTLECEDECGAPVLNAFVPFVDFIPVESAA